MKQKLNLIGKIQNSNGLNVDELKNYETVPSLEKILLNLL